MKRGPLIGAALFVLYPAAAAEFSVVEATIPEMQAAMRDGRLTSRELVTQYLVRIGLYENRINAVLSVNAAALAEAEALDAERAAGKVRGKLHGIPIALKDNIHADGMPTTAGALAFADLRAPYEATLTKNLRDAGAIIIAKTVLTELANWMASAAPNNYSAVGGLSFNPYDPRPDPRPTGDGRGAMPTGSSSSGAGTAANFWAANVGTETSVSIISPASFNMLVGISPTLGRVSRYGVVPITADQDRPGPLARTVTDAAILLGALEGAAPDTNDPQTKRCAPPPGRDYTAYLKADGLKGARLGVPRAWFVEPHQLPGREKPEGGGPPDQTAMLNEAIAVLKARGAIIVDPADIPTVTTQDHTRNIVTWERCFGPDGFRGKDDHCAYTIKYGMKRDFNAWLASLGTAAPVRTLTELRQWNKTHEAAGSMKYGQGLIDLADEPNLETDKARYDTDRARDLRLVGPEGFDAVAKEHKLDAFVLIGSRGVNLLSKPGYPAVTVPFGLVANGGNWPAGWEPKPMPMGITFAGTACTDPRLIEIAYSFEQATRRRRPPDL